MIHLLLAVIYVLLSVWACQILCWGLRGLRSIRGLGFRSPTPV